MEAIRIMFGEKGCPQLSSFLLLEPFPIEESKIRPKSGVVHESNVQCILYPGT
jgi:hypothetical protein